MNFLPEPKLRNRLAARGIVSVSWTGVRTCYAAEELEEEALLFPFFMLTVLMIIRRPPPPPTQPKTGHLSIKKFRQPVGVRPQLHQHLLLGIHDPLRQQKELL